MNATTLRVKRAPGFRIDGASLLPASLAAISPSELPRIALQGAGETCALSDLFDIAQSATDTLSLTIEGDVPWLDRIGAHLAEGALNVHGSVIAYMWAST